MGLPNGKILSQEEFNRLPLKERLLLRAETKLMKHFRGLESANLLTKEQAAEHIGYIKDLVRLAQGVAPQDTISNGAMEYNGVKTP